MPRTPPQGAVAVYTAVSDSELAAFLSAYDLGRARALKGIAEGVENSNFLLQTDRDRYILTLYERRVDAADLPFFLDLMRCAADSGFPCPLPQPARDGSRLGELNGRPAAVFSFLPGLAAAAPTREQVREAGSGCARLHLSTRDFASRRTNALGRPAWRGLYAAHRGAAERLRPGLAAEIDEDLDALDHDWPDDLPDGVIHADLFPDNVFFDGERFAGAIDFYFACTDALAYDLAVMLGAWAARGDGALDPDATRALVEGYAATRPLSPAERAALPVLARGAAMRFFLTRLADWEAHRPGALVVRKDPMEYARALDAHRSGANAFALEAVR